ncbi:hypothetical protein PsYK624_034830 [Phanerochaete sordida]|uniref:Uncharacterized protein n=1 Tax=Phanerochaete sordida TaxID=48140 RepID=A0A9P3L9R0_9APHY|nr:hypothetical protein PsYK624_034830 [Phanerochaete sordida]
MSVPPASYDISVSKAFLVGAWVEGPLLGVKCGSYCNLTYGMRLKHHSIAMYVAYIRMLFRSSSSYTRVLITIATVQMVVAVAHYSTLLVYLIDGLIDHTNDLGGSDVWFANPTRPLFVTVSFFYVTNVMIGDAIVAWRCYMVWGRGRMIGSILLILNIAAIVVGYVSLSGIASLETSEDVFVNYRMMTASFALSVAIQTTATVAIVWKIYRDTAWKYASTGTKGRLAVTWIVVESGVLLSVTTAFLLGTFVVHMNAGFVMGCFLAEMSFMVPTSIIIRSRMKRSGSGIDTLPLPRYSLRHAQPIELIRRCGHLESFGSVSATEGTIAIASTIAAAKSDAHAPLTA